MSTSLLAADYPCVYIKERGGFKKHLKQHQNNVNKKHVSSSALAEHCGITPHTIDWSNARVLAKERNAASRLYLESLYITGNEAHA